MVKAILLDFGGTIDADGIAWADRFYSLYKENGLDISRSGFDRAFYQADDGLAGRYPLDRLDLEQTINRQADSVVEILAPRHPSLAATVARRFMEQSRDAFTRNRPLLARLRRRYRLGIVSNFYGNLENCLAGEGLREFFDFVGDSGKLGVEKPDPAIFKAAMSRLGVAARDCLMVGDSIPRDMRGAEQLDISHVLITPDPKAFCCPRGGTIATFLEIEKLLPRPSTVIPAGIIAAGAGSRLKGDFPETVKPLIPVAGAPLSHWVARSLQAAGVREVVLLHNSSGKAVQKSLSSSFPGIRWSFLEQNTASSWESFRLVAKNLAQRAESFLISTVDALIPPAETARFAHEAHASPYPAAMALTDFIDDDSPLWADCDGKGELTALGKEAALRTHATAGLYYLTRGEAERLPGPKAYASLREYWTERARQKPPILGVPLAKTLDVDRPRDVALAQGFLKEGAPWSGS